MKTYLPPSLVLVLVAVSTVCASAANFYISASGPSGDGSGSSAANAADASTQDKFRTINESQKSPGTVITYGPGTYEVSPAFTMYDGVTHQGAGIDATIIKVADGSAAGSFAPMWLAGKGTISNFKFTDATIDFNSTHTAWWAKGKGMSMAFAFSTADHCTIQRVKFINIGARGMESFPVFFDIGGSANGNINHNLVDSCIFTQPIASGNKDGGLTCIQMADSLPGITTDTTNVVSNNKFLNLKYPEYSDLGYAQCCSCPVATNNTATGVDSLWFVEPGSSGPGPISTFTGVTVQVKDNTTTDSGPIALILMHPNGTFGNIDVENNTVGMTQAPYKFQGPSVPTGFAVATYWPGDSAVGNITVQNNTFTAPLPLIKPPVVVQANPTAPNKFHVASLSVLNNTLVNFPQNGKAYNVATEANSVVCRAEIPHGEWAGWKFDPSPNPSPLKPEQFEMVTSDGNTPRTFSGKVVGPGSMEGVEVGIVSLADIRAE